MVDGERTDRRCAITHWTIYSGSFLTCLWPTCPLSLCQRAARQLRKPRIQNLLSLRRGVWHMCLMLSFAIFFCREFDWELMNLFPPNLVRHPTQTDLSPCERKPAHSWVYFFCCDQRTGMKISTSSAMITAFKVEASIKEGMMLCAKHALGKNTWQLLYSIAIKWLIAPVSHTPLSVKVRWQSKATSSNSASEMWKCKSRLPKFVLLCSIRVSRENLHVNTVFVCL